MSRQAKLSRLIKTNMTLLLSPTYFCNYKKSKLSKCLFSLVKKILAISLIS